MKWYWKLVIFLFIFVLPTSAWVIAGNVKVPRTPSGTLGRGLTMDEVRARKGEPSKVQGPVGDPPITRWILQDNEIVVFEGNIVIDSYFRKDE